MQDDVAYYTIRADEERTAAIKAAHPIARQKHLELASRFQALADKQLSEQASPASPLLAA